MTTDKEHLDFIYHRLAFMHLEDPNVDYMLRFRKIIDSMPSGTGVGLRSISPRILARPGGFDEIWDEAFKAGSTAAIESIEMGLKKSWAVQLAIRIAPMFVMQKFKEKIEEALPLPQTGSESSLSEFGPNDLPLG
jgi:hypothetical protein